MWPIASISAVSVFGRIGSHSAPSESGRSSASGLTSTNRAPRAWAASSDGRTTCRPAPPEPTAAFLPAIPPNATISSVWSTMLRQVTAVLARFIGANTLGRMTADAPAL